MLEAKKNVVLEARDGLDGVEVAKRKHPDIVLCDIAMPKLNGFDVLEQLRNHAATALTPFIFLTAYGDRAHFRRGMEMGADDYLPKPFHANELYNAINTQLLKQSERINLAGNGNDSELGLIEVIRHDQLTQLPNKLSLQGHFENLISDKENTDKHVAVMVLSLTRLQEINDLLGASKTDKLIKHIAGNLFSFADANSAIVARLQAADFAILLPDVTHHKEIELFADSLQKNALDFSAIDGFHIPLSVNIGAAIYPIHGEAINDLLYAANIAKSSVSQNGDSSIQIFHNKLQNHRTIDLQIESALMVAIDNDGLSLVYQPIVNTNTKGIIGLEVLLRWHHPELGDLSPNRFVSIAEKSSLIHKLGDWVFENALSTIADYNQTREAPVLLSINVSTEQLKNPNFAVDLVKKMDKYSIRPNSLILELTESALLHDNKNTLDNLRNLRTYGVKIALDDFGTGYASLDYLTRFSFDILKLDHSIIKNLHLKTNQQTVANAVIDMAHRLHLNVIAEGVESEEERIMLQHYQCNAIQGYLICEPLSFNKVIPHIIDNP